MLVDLDYNPVAVHRAFEAGLKELTGERTLANAWASLVSPDDVVGIKINGIGAPRISSSLASINETIAGLKSAGVKENNIIVWDRMDRDFRRTGLAINRGSAGVRVMGCSTEWEGVLPWVSGYDRKVFVAFEDGTLKKFRELAGRGFTKEASHREIFNSVAWLWTLIQQGNEKAKVYEKEIRRLYQDYSDREGIKRIAEEVAGKFDGVAIEDEEKSYLADIVTKDITKLVNIAVLKHNEDSGVTWATKNIALGVTTNKVRFHIDYCDEGHPRDPGPAVPQGQDRPPHRRGGQDLDGQRRRGPDRPRQPHLLQPRPGGHGPDRARHPRGEAVGPGARIDPGHRDPRRRVRQDEGWARTTWRGSTCGRSRPRAS